MSNQQEAHPGKVICESSFGELPSLSLYITSGIFVLLGVPFLLMSLPLLAGSRKGDLEGALGGIGISILLIGAGILIWRSARLSGKRRVVFHENGVRIGQRHELQFTPYARLKQLRVELGIPDDGSTGRAIARGLFSVAVGNAAGVGAALGSTSISATIHLQVADESVEILSDLSLSHAEQIGRFASESRGENVVRYLTR